MDERIWVLASIALAGCAGDEPADTAPTFTEVRDEILLPSCGFSSCHGGGAGGLQLDEASAYANLVDAESAAAPGSILVVPGDPEDSYLMSKLEGGPMAVTDERMPPPSGGFDPAKIDQIRAWIAAGALDD
ncbi:MAG TPA: hypothetical protein ENK18_14935 [Deltaproteobacteria bacterium]|nr:hypothetical protein [Deltaproteobacteria bacterium]